MTLLLYGIRDWKCVDKRTMGMLENIKELSKKVSGDPSISGSRKKSLNKGQNEGI